MKHKRFKAVIIVLLAVVVTAIGFIYYELLNPSAPENDVLLFDNYYIYRFNSMSCKIYEKDKFEPKKDMRTTKLFTRVGYISIRLLLKRK